MTPIYFCLSKLSMVSLSSKFKVFKISNAFVSLLFLIVSNGFSSNLAPSWALTVVHKKSCRLQDNIYDHCCLFFH